MGNCRDTPSAELQHLAGQYDAEMCRPEYVGGEDNEVPYFEATCKQAARLTSFGNVPLLIISQDPDRRREGMPADAIAELPVWAREQEASKSLSPLSWRVVARGSGHAAQPNISQDVIRELSLPLPELAAQQRIAAQLEQADRLRSTRRYALELTDTFLPAAFLELFGDPAENPRAFNRVQLEGLFAQSRDGAKCGPFGSALKKHEYVAAGIPVWTMNNVGANEFVEDGCLYITPQKFEELGAYDAQNGDILISRAGTVGRMAIVRTKHPRSIIHSNIIRLSLHHAKILPIYFVALMTWFAPRVARLKRGQEDAYTFMSTGSLGELQIPLPPFPLQQNFAALVERVERLRAVQREALRQADHLFTSLLHNAFGG